MRFNDKHIKLDNNEPDEEFRQILATVKRKTYHVIQQNM